MTRRAADFRRLAATPLVVPALKSYGDFVIALGAVARARRHRDAGAPIVIVAGRHLQALAEALDVTEPLSFVGDTDWSDVPAAFDVGKRGKLAAVRSLLELRRCFRNLHLDRTMLFDRLGWRERFIAASHSCQPLPPKAPNIYFAYEQALEQGAPQMPARSLVSRAPRRAVVVPGSRLSHKVLPGRVVHDIGLELTRRGIDVSIVVLEGEAVDVPRGVPVEQVPRTFDALIAALRTADMVISADSLSAHLAEYLRLPVFVATPVPNVYWLPRQALVDDSWATFADLQPLGVWLDRQSQADRRVDGLA